jgi:hypothetical protein
VTQTVGCLHIHACPASLLPAVERAVASCLPECPAPVWYHRDEGTSYADVDWSAAPGCAALLAHSLRLLGAVTFEVTEQASAGQDGERFSFVPGLGLYRAGTNAAGDLVVDENQLGAALRESPNAEALRERIGRLLGRPWDDVLEPLRWRTHARPLISATG